MEVEGVVSVMKVGRSVAVVETNSDVDVDDDDDCVVEVTMDVDGIGTDDDSVVGLTMDVDGSVK